MAGQLPGSPAVDNLTEPLRSDALAVVAESGGAVWIESGWRSRDSQQQLYDRNCHNGVCNPATAKPGTSQHELGRAVDFGGNMSTAASLAARHRLVRTVPGEAWHYEEAGNRADLGGINFGLGLPNPLDAVSAVRDALAKLTDPHLWLRVAMVIGGLTLCVIGAAVLHIDLGVPQAVVNRAPGVGELHGAAGTGEAVA